MSRKGAPLGVYLLSIVSCRVPSVFIFLDIKANADPLFQGRHPEAVPIVLLLGNNQPWTISVFQSWMGSLMDASSL